jgi:transposase
MRILGLDIHRTFAEVVILEGGQIYPFGRVLLDHGRLTSFAQSLLPTDEVVLEATGNTMAVVHILEPVVKRVVIANPLQVRAIAHAKIKTDKIDAAILAQLYASGFLPEVWTPDASTEALRRQVATRHRLVRHRTRIKNIIHSILHTNLIPRCPASDLFGCKGRVWLGEQPLPLDERQSIQRYLRDLDRLNEDICELDTVLAAHAINNPQVQRLMTISGINTTVAVALVAAIGDIHRFASPEKLVSYFGLNPSVRQSGLTPAHHGHITKRGRSHARAMLVEAAWSAAKSPGPLRAFFCRIRAKRGAQIAAVATARKLTSLAWHLLTKEEDYLWVRPALLANKMRRLALHAGAKPQRGKRGSAHAYFNKSLRDQELAWVENAERAYNRFVKHWQSKPNH